MNRVEADSVEGLPQLGPDLAALIHETEKQLSETGLADRAFIFRAALHALERESNSALWRSPLLLLDQPVLSSFEAAMIGALGKRSSNMLITAPAGDSRSVDQLEQSLACAAEFLPPQRTPHSLSALKSFLFEKLTPPRMSLDDTVTFHSWPGEARECAEIARQIQIEAGRGVPFDHMAIFLRSPAEYQPPLQEALRRAAIPAFFASGARRPEPGGRALLALLSCAAEGLSARRFAEYLSLAQVPDANASGPKEQWVAPDHDLLNIGSQPDSAGSAAPVPVTAPTASGTEETGGTLRAPWRWEELIVDAAVIGGKDRWVRRLDGLEGELSLRRKNVTDEDEARAAFLDRQLADLRHLRAFALPLIERLAALPKSASWGEWLRLLRDLANAALREPELALSTLAELDPMAPVGPVDLDEVQLVLTPRLRELTVPPPRRRYGSVFVAPATSARGLVFDVVFIPGLAEKLFPRKIVEDPILADAHRARLGVAELEMQPTRVAGERLALRLAVGAAGLRVHLSYPRIDVEQARPRVPSFYGLETFRAAEGSLPGFDELRRRAEAESSSRLGWPAPSRAEDAIDEAEFDLAVLSSLSGPGSAAAAGPARYLLTANPHLARALRARGRRWLQSWTVADGLVNPEGLARQTLAQHQFSARSFSPTALQNFAVCPYKFFLQAVHRLEPREEPVALEALDPLTRGALFHDVQFEVLSRLKAGEYLPVTDASLPQALSAVDRTLDAVAADYADKLAPAIPRVWDDAIGSIRADLREWLRRMAVAKDGWEPERFELSFGLADRDRKNVDPASVPNAVPVLAALQLRGSVDLVERHPRGVLRATDHKTGKVRAEEGVTVGGGKVLQPILYALACEQILGGTVEAGRLYYCTADGAYQERVVPLDPVGREAAQTVIEIIGRSLETGFLPAMPEKGACEWCDYRPVCGPHEELRTSRKRTNRLADLARLRGLP